MRFGLLLIAASLAFAETPQLPEPYRSMVDLAHAAPPEFAADALLRMVESGQIADRDARLDLLEQAFRLAIAAKFPLRMRPVAGITLDTRAGSLSQAYALKLDGLSLQSRAVRDALRIDPAKARKLFQEIPPPLLSPLTCDDALFYDLDDFYQALGAVVNGAFTEKERAKEEHLNLLLNYVSQVISPAQFLPLAQVIQSASVTSDQREILWTQFNGILQNIQADDRSYSALAAGPGQSSNSDALALIKRSLPKTFGCKGDGTPGGEAPNRGTQQRKIEPTPKIEPYWQSSEAQRLFEQGKSLRTSADGKTFTEADRATQEWQRQLTDYINALAAWGPGQEKSEADYYNEKCEIYAALVELIPTGPQRDKMVDAFVDFLSSSGMQQQSPVEWFVQANFMLERVRGTSGGEPGKVLAAFERSGNPVLILETALEKTLGIKAPSWVPSSN